MVVLRRSARLESRKGTSLCSSLSVEILTLRRTHIPFKAVTSDYVVEVVSSCIDLSSVCKELVPGTEVPGTSYFFKELSRN